MPDDFTPYALVVDDDPIIRMESADILEDAGFRVHEAAHVAEALVILDNVAPSIQLLFTDVQMPPGERNGFELARRTAERYPHIRILVASGVVRPGANDMPEGAVFISKPFSPQVVLERLRQLFPDGEKPAPLRNAG